MVDVPRFAGASLLAVFYLSACRGQVDSPTDQLDHLGTTAGSLESDTTEGGDVPTVFNCDARFEDFQRALEANVKPDRDWDGGITAAVQLPGCGLWRSAVGDVHDDQPLRSDHLVRIASITKTHVAAAVLSSARAGHFGLDDRLEDHIPGLPNGEHITIRQLLQHSSGVTTYSRDEAFRKRMYEEPERKVSPQEIIETYIKLGPSFEPGDQFGYSNTNYILLGVILEQAEGRSIAEILRTRVLEPAKLESTFIPGEGPLKGELAPGWGWLDQGSQDFMELTHAVHPSVPWTSGYLLATPSDVVKWAQFLYNGHLLRPDDLSLMLSDTVDVEYDDALPEQTRSGYGVFIRQIEGVGTTWGHSGSLPGYASDCRHLPDLNVSLAATVTNHVYDQWQLLDQALDAMVESIVKHAATAGD